MSDDIWKRDEIQSPCVQICMIHPEARICTGCFRSIEEITNWSKMTSEARADVMAKLPSREPLLKKRRGGRQAKLGRR